MSVAPAGRASACAFGVRADPVYRSAGVRFACTLLGSLLVALALAACGGDDDPAGPSGEGAQVTGTTETTAEEGPRPLDRDPCELLGRARIRGLFGEAVRGRAEEGQDANVCGYRSSRPADPDATPPVPSGIDVFLGVEYFVGLSREFATQRGTPAVRPVPGVGDSAYVAGNEAGAVIGDAGVMVSVLGLNPSEPEVEDLLVELLEDAVAGY